MVAVGAAHGYHIESLRDYTRHKPTNTGRAPEYARG